MEAIEILWNIKRNRTVDEIADRASCVLERALVHGISRLRTHVDVDPIGGTRPAEGLIRARDRFRDLMDIQIVAFPQEGIVKSPGTEALMRQVMKSGVDVVGGMPFNEVSPADSRRHIEIAFDIAREFDADIDMHVDETDDPMARAKLCVGCHVGSGNRFVTQRREPDAVKILSGLFEDAAKAAEIVATAGFSAELAGPVADAIQKLWTVYLEEDATLVEVNPLVRTEDGSIVALDGKVTLDENAGFRHPDHADLEDAEAADPLEA